MDTMVNQHLNGAPKGDRDTAFVLQETKKYALGGGSSSGHVPPGAYELKINDAMFMPKAGGKVGTNIQVELEVVAPVGYAGTKIFTRIGSPTGENTDTFAEQLTKLLKSCMSFAGVDPDSMPNETKVSPRTFINKKCGAMVKDGQGKYANNSEIHFWIGKDEYEAKIEQSAAQSAPASKPQSNVPELGAPAAAAPAAQPAATPAPVATPAPTPAPVSKGAAAVDALFNI